MKETRWWGRYPSSIAIQSADALPVETVMSVIDQLEPRSTAKNSRSDLLIIIFNYFHHHREKCFYRFHKLTQIHESRYQILLFFFLHQAKIHQLCFLRSNCFSSFSISTDNTITNSLLNYYTNLAKIISNADKRCTIFSRDRTMSVDRRYQAYK